MKNKKKRKIITMCIMFGLYITLSPTTAFAANQVPEMEIDVVLQEDGSAEITQTWTTSTEEGTEFYLGCHDNGYLEITDFSVSDEIEEYAFVENWDIDSSFEEKAYKCGIVETDEGVELCWGISEYGENTYTLQYTLHNLVGSYNDADGFNHRFVDEMSFFPTDVSLTIRSQDGTPLTDEECDIWAFGYEGQIQFADDEIYAWTESPLEDSQNMTIMVSMEKGILTPVRTMEDSFETVKERALEGSDYEDFTEAELEEEDTTIGDWVLCGVVMVSMLGVCWGFFELVLGMIKKIGEAGKRRQLKKVDYFRDIPNNGNLNVTHYLGYKCGHCEEENLLGAYLLQLISKGYLEPEDEGVDTKQVKLRLVRQPAGDNLYEDVLYTVLEVAAGEDKVLQPKELERYFEQNHKPIVTFMESCEKNAKDTLKAGKCLIDVECTGKGSLTEKGRKQLNEILGLKRFLLDFSLIAEREVKETIIWQDYMVYAMLMGIADKVAPQIKELYPEVTNQLEQYERRIHYVNYYNRLLYRGYANERRRQEMARSSGSGGRASYRGGGGFSGGGRGGTR